MITSVCSPVPDPSVGHRRLGSRIGVLLGVVALLLGAFSIPATAAEDPAPTNVAGTAAPDASYTAPWNSLPAINDGSIGTGLNQMWGNYTDDRPEQAWVSYHWDTPVSISRSVMSFWADAPEAGTGDNVWVPKAWKLQYKSASSTDWTDVVGADAYGTDRQQANVTGFPAVTVTDVRALLEAYPSTDGSRYSALSIPEWEVWGVPAGAPPTSPADPVAVDEIHLPTAIGVVPTLPTQVWTTAADGRRVAVPVSWPAISAAQVAEPGTFTVTGSPTGIGNDVRATVYVRAADASTTPTGYLPLSALTVAGVAPDLPATVPVTYADGAVDSRIPVTWASIDPADYAAPGLFTVGGTVAGTDLKPEITVFVDAPADGDAAPVVRLAVTPDPPATGWYTGPVTVQISASSDTDPTPARQFRLDDGPWSDTTDGQVVVDTDGTHTLLARAADRDGRTSLERSVTIAIDATAPVTTADAVDQGDTVQLTLTATDAGSGVATVQYQVGDEFVATYAGSPIGVRKLDQPQTVRYFATDKAGNTGTAQTLEIPAATAAATTTTTAALSAADLAIGRRLVVTATVSGPSAAPPAGVVVVRSGETEIGRGALVGGRVRIGASTLGLTPGDLQLTVGYEGDGTSAPSSATVPFTLHAAASRITAVAAPATAAYGAPILTRVAVTATGITPGGEVRISEGDTVLATGTLAAGRTLKQLPRLGVGQHTLTVSYLGDGRVEPSTTTTTVTVTPAATSLSVAISPNPPTSRTPLTATVTATAAVPGLVPTGSVQVSVRAADGRSVATATGGLAAGRAGVVLPAIPAGSYTLAVIYPGSKTTAATSVTRMLVVRS